MAQKMAPSRPIQDFLPILCCGSKHPYLYSEDGCALVIRHFFRCLIANGYRMACVAGAGNVKSKPAQAGVLVAFDFDLQR